MTPGNTPLRAIRIPDELWKRAKEVAAKKGESISEVIRRSLTEYITKK